MKQLFSILSFALILSACGNSGDTGDEQKQTLLEKGEMIKKTGKAETAIDYNDGIIGLQAQIITEMTKVMQLESVKPVEDLKHLIITIKECRAALQRLEAYEGGEAMKEKADSLFNFYQRACEGPWMEAYTIFEESRGAMTDEEQEKFKQLLEKGGENEAKFDEAFAAAQEEFARKHNFEIITNAIQDDVDKINK